MKNKKFKPVTPQDNIQYDIIIPGVLESSSEATYRTQDGRSYYKFRYVKVGSHYEIDIISQPTYSNRNSSQHTAHWLPSSRGGRMICVSRGKEPRTLDGAKSLSTGWAELTNTYIKTGKTIDDQVIANNKGGFFQWLFG
jgi:hypothetical protein